MDKKTTKPVDMNIDIDEQIRNFERQLAIILKRISNEGKEREARDEV